MSYLQIKEGVWQGLHSDGSLDDVLVLDLDTFEVESVPGAELGTMDLITPKDEALGARFMDHRGTLSCPSRRISYKRIDGTDIVILVIGSLFFRIVAQVLFFASKKILLVWKLILS